MGGTMPEKGRIRNHPGRGDLPGSVVTQAQPSPPWLAYSAYRNR